MLDALGASDLDLSGLVKSRLGGVDLGEDVLAGHIFVDHAVDGLHLADDLFQTPVQIVCVHTLSHKNPPFRRLGRCESKKPAGSHCMERR